MAGRRRLLIVEFVAALSLAACGSEREPLPITHQSQSFQAVNANLPNRAPPVANGVTGERLVRARTEPQNWMTYYGAYDAQRYSALTQISVANVKRLAPEWVFQYGIIGLTPNPATIAFETAPLVIDGVMYATGADGYVWAIDASTGQSLWEYHYTLPFDVALYCGNVNRGVAVMNGKVFFVTANGHVIALNASNGKLVWDQIFLDVRAGETATLAPLAIKDKVLVGSSGAEYGVRGHIDAFEAATGRRLWRFYPVPKPGEPGAETWGGDAWARGGGTAWVTGSYDPLSISPTGVLAIRRRISTAMPGRAIISTQAAS
jgi:alcohol dehydrogenase (cytochrome c)